MLVVNRESKDGDPGWNRKQDQGISMDASNQRNCKITRRAVLNAGIALATAASASPLPQQPPPGPGRGAGRGPARKPEPPFKPTEAANSPLGTGKGIHPGRVVWIHEPKVALWDGKTGSWWEDAYTDPKLTSEMVSRSLQSLTGEKSNKQAWNSLFKFFNHTRKLGNNGYRPGEKIAIKLNSNQDRPGPWRPAAGMPTPQAVYELVHQLVAEVGVRGEDIIVYDASRYIGDPIFGRIKGDKNSQLQAIGFVVNPTMAGNGRTGAVPDKANPVKFSKPGVPTAYLPQCLTAAKYVINYAVGRGHQLMGMTGAAKNHFGSVFFESTGSFTPAPLHDFAANYLPMGSYNALTDLIAHKHVGGKTMVFMTDFLYVAPTQNGDVGRYKSFDDNWCGGLFASQDPVAIDSVALDFIRNEPTAECRGLPDNYLHEAALAEKAPSGTLYDPSQEGKPVGNLGVHEHWNNPTDKKYSRNLGKREGIELVSLA
jgi:hypothetical protein